MRGRRTERFRPSPPVSLVTAEGFAGIGIDGDGGGEAHEHVAADFSLAIADVQNCFHYLKIGDAYGEFFCYPYKVTAKEMKLVGKVYNGRRLRPDDEFWLAATSLPMGHSWSLFFCQRGIELRAAASPGLENCTLMRDRGPSILLRPAADSKRVLRIYDPTSGSHYYVYVDNLGVLSASKEEAKAKLDSMI